MSSIEIIIVSLLLFMAVPDFCRKLRRPALAYSVFVLLGMCLGPLANSEVATMLTQAGQVGFLLLLFEVGLEIDLPAWPAFGKALRFAGIWTFLQYPVVTAVALFAGLNLEAALIAGTALTGCSVGMAYPAWKQHPELGPNGRLPLLHRMVALEMVTIVMLAVDVQWLEHGLNWGLAARLVGIALVIILIGRFAIRLMPLIQTIIEKATHWRVHLLVILLLAVCALGERLGLDAAKTAFFLGLALSRTNHHGMRLADHIAPISHRFLIPIFFLALGLRLEWQRFATTNTLLAVGLAGLLLGLREMLYRRWPKRDAPSGAYLLFCPNLTMVALAANALLAHSAGDAQASWLLLCGLFVTVPAICLLPASSGEADALTPSPAGDSHDLAAVGHPVAPAPRSTAAEHAQGQP